MTLWGVTACGLFGSSELDEDGDDPAGAGGEVTRGGKPGTGGDGADSGNAGTSEGGASGTAAHGGESGNSAGGATGGTLSVTGGASTGGSLSTGGANPSGGELSMGGVATGGSSGASSAGAGAGGDAPIDCGASWAVTDGGYVIAPGSSGCWRGYAYTGTGAAGSTITPTSFGMCGSPCMLCASGSVAADVDYAGVGLLGFNLNQMVGTDTKGTVTPTGTGLTVSFTNPGGSPLRIQIGGPNAATLETDRWCFTLTGSSGTVTIPYASFSTTCWNTTGTAYARQPIQTVQLLVPGDDLTSTSFSVCLTGVGDG